MTPKLELVRKKITEEPKIQINDHALTESQAMALRVAVTDFHRQLCDPEFVSDLGPISGPYKDRLTEVLTIMFNQAH